MLPPGTASKEDCALRQATNLLNHVKVCHRRYLLNFTQINRECSIDVSSTTVTMETRLLYLLSFLS